MRNMFLAGTVGLFIVGVADTASAHEANPNVPNSSPYTLMGFPGEDTVVANPGYGGNPGFPAGTWPRLEGRAAYVEPTHSSHGHHSIDWRLGTGDDKSGYDNSRQDSAYPPGEAGTGY
jgi:hypothetical protein